MPKKGRTLICVVCNERQPDKGRICEHCRNEKRKQNGQYSRYYWAHRDEISAKRKSYHYGSAKHRRDALAIHGAKCADCGWDAAEVVLHVHHIDTNRQNGDPSNLVILCPTCHYYRHFLENTGIYAFYI